MAGKSMVKRSSSRCRYMFSIPGRTSDWLLLFYMFKNLFLSSFSKHLVSSSLGCVFNKSRMSEITHTKHFNFIQLCEGQSCTKCKNVAFKLLHFHYILRTVLVQCSMSLTSNFSCIVSFSCSSFFLPWRRNDIRWSRGRVPEGLPLTTSPTTAENELLNYLFLLLILLLALRGNGKGLFPVHVYS